MDDDKALVFDRVKDLKMANGKVRLAFSTEDNKMLASFITKDGANIFIPKINHPKEFALINSSEEFDKFFENAYARVVMSDDDEPNLYVFQKGYGGSGQGGKINISTPKPPAPPQPPSQPVTGNISAGYSGNGRVEPGKGGNVVIQGGLKFRF